MEPSASGIFVLASGGSDIVLVIVSVYCSLSLVACSECCCAVFTSSIFSHTLTFN
jgi:hypothetical protein